MIDNLPKKRVMNWHNIRMMAIGFCGKHSGIKNNFC